MKLFHCTARLLEIENSDEKRQSQRSALEGHIKRMIDDLPFTVGEASEQRYGDHLIGAYDKLPAELHDDELMLIGSGQPLMSGDSIAEMRLPAPRQAAPDAPPQARQGDLP